jgi:hypothetical protein
MFDLSLVDHDPEMERISVENAAEMIQVGSLADRRELLSLLRARICLSCAVTRTGTFTECPMCRSTYLKDP